MSNRIIEKDLAKTAKNVKATVKKIHTNAINTSENLVEETIAAGEQWQEVMDKALHAGIGIFAKQQDLTLTTLEAVKEQYLSGNDRLVKLLGLEGFDFNQWTSTFFKKAKVASATAANKVNKTILKAEEKANSEAIKAKVEKTKKELNEKAPTVAKVVEKAAKTAKVAAKGAKTAVKKTAATAKKTTAKAVKNTQKAAKETTKAADKAVKANTAKVEKAVAKTVKAVTPKVAKDKLTLIEGIGPKIEEVLNNAGIFTYQALSLRTADDLEKILLTADPRYKRFQPTTWAAQAKFAAEGKMEELAAWQEELKGGIIVKS